MQVYSDWEALHELIASRERTENLPANIVSCPLIFEGEPLRIIGTTRIVILRHGHWRNEQVILLEFWGNVSRANLLKIFTADDPCEVSHAVLKRWGSDAECRKWNPQVSPSQVPLMVLGLLRVATVNDKCITFTREHSTEYILHY